MKDVVKLWPISSLGKIWIGPNLDYRLKLWIDENLRSYSGVPNTPANRKRLAKRLREIAGELEAWK